MSRVVVIGKIMSLSPRDVHLLIPRTCAYATLHGKGKWRLLIGAPQNRKIVLHYSGGPTITARVLKNGPEQQNWSECCGVRAQPAESGFKDEVQSPLVQLVQRLSFLLEEF